MGKFSVAMSVYKNDNPTYFFKALESITDLQTLKPDEICLVIDGPISKELYDVILNFDKRYNFKIKQLEKNVGLGNALKIATEMCSYEIIARMDSDDVAIPTRFEKQLIYLMDNPDVDIVGGNISEFIDNELNVVSYRCVPSTNEDIKEYIKKRCPFNHMTVMFKKEAILSCGGYIEIYHNEDYYLWIRMYLNNARFSNLNEVLVNVRIGKDMYVRRGGLKYFKSERQLQKIMYKNHIIGAYTYIINILKRFIVQCLLPGKVRGWVFRKFAR